jgi:DNA-binding transcriptional LysR family regulator
MSEELILIAPREKRFENIESADVARLLREEYFVVREVGSGTRLEYEAYLKSLGVRLDELKVNAHFNNTQSIIHAVSSGLGLSIVSELAAKLYIRNKMVVPIYLDATPKRMFYIVLKKNYPISTTVHAFINFLHSYSEASKA